jgi:hypothetical protein
MEKEAKMTAANRIANGELKRSEAGSSSVRKGSGMFVDVW